MTQIQLETNTLIPNVKLRLIYRQVFNKSYLILLPLSVLRLGKYDSACIALSMELEKIPNFTNQTIIFTEKGITNFYYHKFLLQFLKFS